jgi:MPBQ/MSBQ methyltransferase
MRLMQHKREAFWFYRFLSIFYDKLVNPLFWTERMRDEALQLARLDDRRLTVIDVGSGTGFTTQGIVRQVDAMQVTCVDQSPHQMAKAREKPDLQGCSFHLGDAENIPFPADQFDRYVSAGSIEYWPNPQQGINEAYRVIKPGGLALMIGPLEPKPGLARFMANTWMLFPKDEEYRRWYQQAGFADIEVRYIRPHWFRGGANDYGLAIAGRKPQPGVSPNPAPPPAEPEAPLTFGRRLRLFSRLLVGSLAGFIFIPAALFRYFHGLLRPGDVPREKLNRYQVMVLVVIGILIAGLVWWIL